MSKDTYTRSFSYGSPVDYQGYRYPSTMMDIEDENGNVASRQVFADANGQYYSLDANGNAVPVILQNSLDEVVVKPNMENLLTKQFNDYLTQSSDNTQMLNVPHRDYNPHLRYGAIRGAKSNALWEEEHPNATAWSYAGAALPLAVAAAPFVLGAGDALAATSVGNLIGSGLGMAATTASESTWLPWLNALASSYYAANGLQDVQNGRFTPQTAMDLMPLAQIGKPMYEAGKFYSDLGRSVFGGKQGSSSGKAMYIFDDIVNKIKSNHPLKGKTEIPLNIKRDAANKYIDFINSEEYQNRLRRAGLEEHWQYMKDLTNRKINNNNYFPGKVEPEILGDPNVKGLANSNPNDPNYGITLQEDLVSDEIVPALNHELSHWVTASAKTDDVINIKNPNFFGTPNVKYIGNIMRYNESIAPNISWDDSILPELLKKNKTIGDLNKQYEDYNYLIDPQEKRARAWSIFQQAKEAGISTDEFVDKYTKNGKIIDTAPTQLQQMGEILTQENLKKYLKDFLSIAAPISITELNTKQNE